MLLPPPITSRSNVRVKALRASLSGDARRPGDLLGLEGEHLLKEAHGAGLSFETVYVREGSEATLHRADGYHDLRTGQWAVLSRDVFDTAVSTATPQGVAATWRIRHIVPQRQRQPTSLIIENLQDPGNLGTLIRSMAAFGMERVFVTPETVNEWNPKVVRSAAGASFQVPVTRLPLAAIVDQLRLEGVRLFAAVSGFLNGPEYGFAENTARHGVFTGRMASWAAPAGYQADQVEPPKGTPVYPASLSFDADFLPPCAILIGNEGAGLSLQARALADEQVQIPCSIESLNAAVAGSVLLYEVMRQQPLRQWAREQGLRS